MGKTSWVAVASTGTRRRIVIAVAALTLVAAAAAFPPRAKANVWGPMGCDSVVDGNPCHFTATDMPPGMTAGQPTEGYISYTAGTFVIHDETDPTQADFTGSGPGAAHIAFDL